MKKKQFKKLEKILLAQLSVQVLLIATTGAKLRKSECVFLSNTLDDILNKYNLTEKIK